MPRKVFQWSVGTLLVSLFVYSATYSIVDEFLYERENVSYTTMRWVCRLLPDAGDTCFRKAYFDYHNADYTEAATTAKDVLGREPTHTDAREIAVLSYIELGESSEACRLMEAHIDEMPDLALKRKSLCRDQTTASR